MELNVSNTTSLEDITSSGEAAATFWTSMDVKHIFYVIVTVTMSLFGTIGNLMVIGALLVHKRLRVLSNVFIGNLAVADFCVSAVTNPITAVAIFYTDLSQFFTIFPEVCETLAVLCTIACLCSVWSMSAISLNRYVAICHRAYYQRIYNKVTVPCYVVLMWMYAFTLDISNFFGWSGHVFDAKAYFCTINYTANYSYNLFFIIFGLCVPMSITCFSYINIFLFARRSEQRLKKHNKNAIKTNDLRLLKSVGTICATFMLMWTPYGLVLLLDVYHWPQWYWLLAIALAHSNSSINSLLYAATNKNFREGYAILIRRICCCTSFKKSSEMMKIFVVSDGKMSSSSDAI